jgi:hypothetical protein
MTQTRSHPVERWTESCCALHKRVRRSFTGNLAQLRLAQGRLAEAEPLASRSLRMRERCQGLEHPDVGEGLEILAAILRERGLDAEAETLKARAVTLRRGQDIGPDSGLA